MAFASLVLHIPWHWNNRKTNEINHTWPMNRAQPKVNFLCIFGWEQLWFYDPIIKSHSILFDISFITSEKHRVLFKSASKLKIQIFLCGQKRLTCIYFRREFSSCRVERNIGSKTLVRISCYSSSLSVSMQHFFIIIFSEWTFLMQYILLFAIFSESMELKQKQNCFFCTYTNMFLLFCAEIELLFMILSKP